MPWGKPARERVNFWNGDGCVRGFDYIVVKSETFNHMETAVLTIERKTEFINGFRTFQVFIDGKHVGKVANGSSVHFELEPGTHTVAAKVDWCKSHPTEVTLGAGEEVTLHVGAYSGLQSMLLASLVLFFLLFLRPDLGQEPFYIFLLVLPVLILLGFFTVGRRHYIKVRKP